MLKQASRFYHDPNAAVNGGAYPPESPKYLLPDPLRCCCSSSALVIALTSKRNLLSALVLVHSDKFPTWHVTGIGSSHPGKGGFKRRLGRGH
jgi:hypothetical protein